MIVKKSKTNSVFGLQTRVDEKSLVSVILVPVSPSSKKAVQFFSTKLKRVNREGQKFWILNFSFSLPAVPKSTHQIHVRSNTNLVMPDERLAF